MQVIPDLLHHDAAVEDGRKVRRAEKLQRGIAKKVCGRPTLPVSARSSALSGSGLSRSPFKLAARVCSQTRLCA